MRARRLLLFALLAASGLVACQIIAGVEYEQGVMAPDAEASAAVADAGEAEAAAPPPCGLVPPQPQGDDVGESLTFNFAIRTLVTKRNGVVVGYDLDGLCTTGPSNAPCVGSPPDTADGIDNGFAAIVDMLPNPGNIGTDTATTTANQTIAAGLEGVFMQLSSYNTKPNDTAVSLAMANSPGLAFLRCGRDGQKVFTDAGPTWDGCDVWSLGDTPMLSSTLPPGSPGYATGYVVNGMLVINFGDGVLDLMIGDIPLTIHRAIVTADIVQIPDYPDGGVFGGIFEGGMPEGGTISDGGMPNYSLQNGIIAGRITVPDFFALAGEVKLRATSGGTPTRLCVTPGGNALAAKNICPQRDILVSDGDRTQICDGVSVAIGFEAFPAQFGVAGDAGPAQTCPVLDASCDTPK
jgi:hypothetical protein